MMRSAIRDFVLPLTLYVLAVGMLILMAVAWSSRAYAQTPQCGPFDKVSAFLAETHHEKQVGIGILSEKSAALLFSSEHGETWTMVVLNVDGVACIVLSGGDWSQSRVPAIGERGA